MDSARTAPSSPTDSGGAGSPSADSSARRIETARRTAAAARDLVDREAARPLDLRDALDRVDPHAARLVDELIDASDRLGERSGSLVVLTPDEAAASATALEAAAGLHRVRAAVAAAQARATAEIPSTAHRGKHAAMYRASETSSRRTADFLMAKAAYRRVAAGLGISAGPPPESLVSAADAMLSAENDLVDKLMDVRVAQDEHRTSQAIDDPRRLDAAAVPRRRVLLDGVAPSHELIFALRGEGGPYPGLPADVKLRVLPRAGARKYGVEIAWPPGTPARRVRLATPLRSSPRFETTEELQGATTSRRVPLGEFVPQAGVDATLEEDWVAGGQAITRRLYRELKAARSAPRR